MNNERSAVIVGASGLIGAALVKSLTQHGCRVAAVARHLDVLNQVVSATDGRAVAVQADATSGDAVRRCIAAAMGSQDVVDFLIYAAGITPDLDIPLASYSEDAWDATFDTYVKGFFLFFRETLPLMRQGGHILAISSAVTRFPEDKLPPGIFVGHYAASKAALDEFCKWARREAHERGVLLSRFAPGAVDGPFHRNAPLKHRPPSLLPLETVVNRVIGALMNGTEIDEQLVASLPSK